MHLDHYSTWHNKDFFFYHWSNLSSCSLNVSAHKSPLFTNGTVHAVHAVGEERHVVYNIFLCHHIQLRLPTHDLGKT